MDVNALSRITQAAPTSATTVPVDNGAQNRQVVQAVKALNKSEMFGSDNDLERSRKRGWLEQSRRPQAAQSARIPCLTVRGPVS